MRESSWRPVSHYNLCRHFHLCSLPFPSFSLFFLSIGDIFSLIFVQFVLKCYGKKRTVGIISIIAALLSAQITALPPIDSSLVGKEVESEDDSDRGSEHSLEERRAREIEMVEDCQF